MLSKFKQRLRFYASKKIDASLHITESVPALFGFGVATLAKAVGGILVIKLSAIMLGPSVFGRLGQLMTLVAIISAFAGGGTSSALIHALSSTSNSSIRRRKWGAALKIFGCASTFVGIVLILFCHSISQWLLGDSGMAWVIIVLAFSQWLVGFGNLLQAILGSQRKVGTVARINLIGIFMGVAVFSLLLVGYGVTGAALGLVLMPAMLGLASLWVWKHELSEEWQHPLWQTTWGDIRELTSYSLIMLVATTCIPTAHLIVRDMVSSYAGWHFVGYWQGMLKISDVYMQFVAMACVYYALPRFSAQPDIAGLNREFGRILRVLIAFMLFGFVILYFVRDIVVHLLFSDAFVPMRDYFLPYMIGDVFSIVSTLYLQYVLSRGARWLLVGYNIIITGAWLLASAALLSTTGGLTPAYAHLVANVFACLFIMGGSLYNRKRWEKKAPPVDVVAEETILLG